MASILRLTGVAALAVAFLFVTPLSGTGAALAKRSDTPAADHPTDFSGKKDGRGGGGQQQRQQQRQQPRIQQPRVQQRQQQRVLQQHRGQKQQQQRVHQQQRQHQKVQQRQQQQRVQQKQRHEQQKVLRDRDRQRHQDRQKAQQQQKQDRQKAQQQRQEQQKALRDRDRQQRQDRQKAQQQQRQDRHKSQAQQRDREQRRKNEAQQRERNRQAHQRDRQQKKNRERVQRDKARHDRSKQRAERDRARKFADTQRAKDRSGHRIKNQFSREAARSGRFAAQFRNRDFARVRFARWAPERAWRRGLRAAFVPWGIGVGAGAAVFWPYAYTDLFNYTFWPTGYYGGYWAYAYDDFFDGIWWAEEPGYVTEALAYQPVPSAPAAGPALATGTPGRVQAPAQTAPARVTAATAGEGACGETGRGITAWPFDRIQSALNLSDDQQDLLDALRDAALQAADALRDSCPRTAPRNPVERLQAMLERLEATLEALKIVRPALESFYDSLSDDQQRRFEALGPKLASAQTQDRTGSDQANACGGDKPGLANFPIAKIQETVSPTDDQLDLLDALEDATFKAIDIMKAACPEDPPVTPNERLAATQTRIEAMIEAAKAIQPALEDFYAALNDQQKALFSRMRS